MIAGFDPVSTFLMRYGLRRPGIGPATPGIAGPVATITPPDPAPPSSIPGGAPAPDRRRPFVERLFGGNGTFRGESISDDIGPEAARRAALMFGLSLLEAAPTGNVAAIPASFGSAMAGRDQALSEALERRRQAEKDRMEGERHGESMATSQQGRELAAEDQGFQRETEAFRREQEQRMLTVWGREDEDREGKTASARALVDEIKSVAGEDSYEARRAEGLLLAGPESLDDLRKLHESAVGRARQDEDFDADTSRGIRRGKAEIEAGVASDPRVSDAYTRRLAEGSRGSTAGQPTAVGFNDDVRQEAARIYSVLKDEAEQEAKRAFDADESLTAPPAVDYRGLEERARREAEQIVRERYGAVGGPAGGASSVSDEEVAAVRAALGSRSSDQVAASLRERGVPEDKIAELLRRAAIE